jgi:EAL domain-containing protein (putative c-di-GMP-specific phosphodiesterase class I)
LQNAPGAAERLIVEIVETRAIDDIPETIRVLRAMKALGVRIAMDDFGSGHTSFRNLRSLGVDMVKIDGAFVQNLAGSLDDRFFVRTLASLARHLEIETVAEWVEDMESAQLLTEWGIDYLQGHAIGRAVAPELP